MSNPLSLNINDEVLNNIIKNNPFFINITGAVNICLVRCGQEIDNCNDVEFSTMTNFGKILVLNPESQQKMKCNIKLAFDNTNDNMDEKGESSYTFQKAFVTVPSLHRLNGQIYDMETFLVFSSVQKNGNILYVCLCSLSEGTQFVKGNDWKLLNYKLMDELFLKNNKVPDIYGTSSIDGIPNPVDLSNFIPIEGSRNFYDYTHPNNTNVNIRVFQTPLSVSNDVVSLLKSKLTPGSAYETFKSAIVKSINPTENLFFYFSQDLTDNYKSYEANEKTESFSDNLESKSKNNNTDNKNKKTTKNNNETILNSKNEIESENNNEDNNEDNNVKKTDSEKLTKLETKSNKSDKIISEEDDFNKETEQKKEKEEFSDNDKTISKKNLTILIFIVCILFFFTYIFSYLLLNLIPAKNILTSDEIKSSISEMSENVVKDIIKNRMNINTNLIYQGITTFIVIILCLCYMTELLDKNNIKVGIIITIILLCINAVLSNFYNLKYFSSRIYKLDDNNFSQKENYYYNQIMSQAFGEKINFKEILNILSFSMSDNLINGLSSVSSKISGVPQKSSYNTFNKVAMSGGGDIEVIPGPLKDEKRENELKNILNFKEGYNNYDNKLSTFFNFFKNNELFIFKKIYENSEIKGKLFGLFLFVILILIILIYLVYLFIFNNGNSNHGLNFLIIVLMTTFTVLPSFISLGFISAINFSSMYSLIGLSIIFILLLLFSILWANNIKGTYWGYISVIIIMFVCLFAVLIYSFKNIIALIGGVGALSSSTVLGQGTSGIGTSGQGISGIGTSISTQQVPPGFVEDTEYLKLKNIVDNETEKRILLEKELQNSKNNLLDKELLLEQLKDSEDKIELLKQELEQKYDDEQSVLSQTGSQQTRTSLSSQSDIKSLEEQIKDLEQELLKKSNNVRKKDNMIKILQQNKNNKELQLQKQIQNLSTKTQNTAIKNKKISNLSNEVKEITSKLSNITKNYNNLEKKYTNTKSQLNTTQKQINNLKTDYQNTLTNTRTQLQELSTKKVSNGLEGITNLIKGIQDNITKLNNIYQQLNQLNKLNQAST